MQRPGKFGLQRFGINPRGPMDPVAARIANILLENDEHEPVLEMHFPCGEIIFEESCRFALAGADFTASLDGNPVANWSTHTAGRSGVLRFEKRAGGNRCYLAVDGGLQPGPPGRTGFSTFRLRKGDVLIRNGPPTTSASGDKRASASVRPAYSGLPTVRVVAGGEFDKIAHGARIVLGSESFQVMNDSNRMGFRLHGPPIDIDPQGEMLSAAVTFGTIQLLPDGQLIVLMADHQTSGGYPRIANVISADLPLIGQLGPGDKVAFMPVDIAEAEEAAIRVERDLQKLQISVGFGRYW